jgi:hypothetical protein
MQRSNRQENYRIKIIFSLMNSEIFNKIISFVEEVRWEYDFPLTPNTEVYKDLRITGDDAVEFMIAFGKRFNVDLSKFKIGDYFDGEGMNILTGNGIGKKGLTLGDLERGIAAGKLDDTVLN